MTWQDLNSRAYVPYSKKERSCIVEGSKGGLFAGVRIENISFPLTISAIQAACCICLSEGESPISLFLPDEDYEQLDYWVHEFGLTVQIVKTPPEPVSLAKTGLQNEEDLLKDLLPKAITTHSDFPVSALLKSGEMYFEGVNVEVQSWNLGLCAERVALAKALASGFSEFTGLWVHTKYGEVSSLCGACRQVIVEHMPLQKIHLHHADGSCSEHFPIDLLPLNFTSNSLKK